MQTLLQDVRFGLRMLGKNPGFTAVAVLTLALGIGANTAIFSLLNQVLLRRLPVKNPSELVVLHGPGPQQGHVSTDGDASDVFSYPVYKGLRDNNSVFSGMLARTDFDASVASHEQTERASGELISGNYFEVLGVQPALGRLFTQEDDRVPGAQPVAVLSHGYWLRRFGGNPGVLNQTLLINNTEMTVVGVAQAGFFGVQVGKAPDVFVPLMMTKQMELDANQLDNWNDYWLNVLGRRKPGATVAQAKAGIDAAYAPLLQEQLPKITQWNEQKRKLFLDKKIVLTPGASGRDVLQRDSGGPIKALFAMVALVLLIACTNVANLLLARGAARQREFAIRAAMGASRGRMIRQLLAESFLCAIAGGAVGLLLGVWLMGLLIPAVASNTGIAGLSQKMDSGVLLFAGGATLVAGLFFGLLPAWRITRYGVSATLKDQGSTTSAGLAHVKMRKALVAGQVAFTLLLLAGASLFTRTLWNLRNLDLGLRADHVITFSLAPQLNGYDGTRTLALADELRGRISQIPGVYNVAVADMATLSGDDRGRNITAEGAPELPEDLQDVDYIAVSPRYFSTLGIPLVSGREFTEADRPGAPKVAIASESMVKRFFPGRNPLGMHFAFGGGNVKPDIEIVGVVKNVKQEHVRAVDKPYVYVPFTGTRVQATSTFYVRTERDPLQLAAELRGEVRALDANLPVDDLQSFDTVIDKDLFAERMVATLSVGFGALAALLAALGIYGVLAYLVVQRTREIGIRMALGAAAAGDVRFLILREVGLMVIAGVAVGLPLAYGLARLSESLLFGVHAGDPLVYGFGLALITAIALAACYVPALRATRVDPLVALRYE